MLKRSLIAMGVCLVLFFAHLPQSHRDAIAKTTAASAAAPVPSVVVAVSVEVPDFTVRELKYRVFYNKGEVKRIPLTDYDFKAAFSDELLNALSQDKRMEWRAPASDESIDVTAIMKKKATLPPVKADRLLLVDIEEYGAFLADLAADKFYMVASFRLVEKAGGKKLWDKNVRERLDLQGKIADMQADNQKGLKQGINKVLETVCAKIAAEIRQAKL